VGDCIDRKAFGHQPIANFFDVCVGCAESRTVFRRSEPAMVLRGMRILLSLEQLLKLRLRFRGWRENKNHSRKIFSGFYA
jgi:hypothetical protein